MKVPYGVGVATHAGPESCTVAGNGGGEALTGVRAGWPLSREITLWIGGPRLWSEAEGSTGCAVMARRTRSPRGRRPHACTQASRTGTGRAHDRPGEDGSQVRANLGDRGR
jgi:RNA-directed DNA polymerase